MTMKALVALLLSGTLAACSPEAAPYRDPFDRFMVDYGRLVGFEYRPCMRTEEEGGTTIISSVSSEQCYRFDVPQRMRGVWMPGLETSEFLPNATRAPVRRSITDESGIWLETDYISIQSKLAPPVQVDYEAGTAAYLIEFVGRRASYPGRYGGGGFFGRHLIILDELISARAIPPTPAFGRKEMDGLLKNWAEEKSRCQIEQNEKESRLTGPIVLHFLRVIRPHPSHPFGEPLDHCPPLGATEPPRKTWAAPIDAIIRYLVPSRP